MKKKPELPDVGEMTNELAGVLAFVREALAPLDETVRGYRDQLIRDGWSETAAEQMAVGLHQLLLPTILNSGS